MAGDKKVVWELNRQQYFATLGQAYWLTNDERYAQAFIAHLESWMDQNPPKEGINWASSLEVAFRSISWLWAFHFFKASPALEPQIFLRATKYLYLNARHLETYLSTYFSPNTHLTGEALGLFYIGTLLPQFKESNRWRTTGFTILMAQLGRHVRSDGVYFEQSSYYHRYTTDFYLHLWILLQANGESIPPMLEEKLSLLLDHLMYITRPDGTTPFFGDDDGGQLVKLDQREANDFRAALSTGAALFMRPDYKFVARDTAEETLWLLGPKGVSALDLIPAREPPKQSTAFEAGGYYVMRDGWTPASNYALFECGRHAGSAGAHAHADALSFELAANGQTLLIDPGTYTYTGSKEMRDLFRSTAAHNTLTIDGESSSISDGPFSWGATARCERDSWITHKQFDYIAASHDGYRRLDKAATHNRSILFIKHNYWVVRDHVASRGDHLLKLWFHFHPDVSLIKSSNNGVDAMSESSEAIRLKLFTFAQGGKGAAERGYVSSCYGAREDAAVWTFSKLARNSEELITFLMPAVAGAPSQAAVSEIEVMAGRVFAINEGGKYDILMIRDLHSERLGRVETARITSDFDLTWARFASERAETPDNLILLGGKTLELNGRRILTSARTITFLVATRIGEQFHVETDRGVLNSSLAIHDLESHFADLNRHSAN